MEPTRRSFVRRAIALGLAVPVGLWLHRNEDELKRLLAQKVGRHTRPTPPSRPRAPAAPPQTFPDETGYRDYLASLRLRHISPHEIINPHRRIRNGIANRLPPAPLWRNLAPTLAVADEIRHRLGVPLRLIASAYRCPAYNEQCPGAASRSYHTRNQALDLVFDTDPENVAKLAETLRAEGFFHGGIGRYPGFIHIDTRGRDADWGRT